MKKEKSDETKLKLFKVHYDYLFPGNIVLYGTKLYMVIKTQRTWIHKHPKVKLSKYEYGGEEYLTIMNEEYFDRVFFVKKNQVAIKGNI